MNETTQNELIKTRRIAFAGLSTDEMAHVVEILCGIEHVEATAGADGSSVEVHYNVAEHTLAELESVLSGEGIRLESGLLERIRLGLIHFSEEIQHDNAHDPTLGVNLVGQMRAIAVHAEHAHQGAAESGVKPSGDAWRNYY